MMYWSVTARPVIAAEIVTVVPVNELNSRTAPIAVPLVISIVCIFPAVNADVRPALETVRVRESPLTAVTVPEAFDGVWRLIPTLLNMEGLRTWVVYPLGFEKAGVCA